MSNYQGLFDTADLLQVRDQNMDSSESKDTSSPSRDSNGPRYANTSHISGAAYANPVDAPDMDQVPLRFSQFIVEQNNYMERAPSRSLVRRSAGATNLVESQATIFSTRLDGSSTVRSRLKSRSRKSRAYPESSSVHLLTRQKAIRSKEGSLAYRFRLRMKKILAKMKRKLSPMWNFVAGSRKATSSVKRPLRKLKRARFMRPPQPMTISAPMNNPNLGRGATAGRQSSIHNERAGKMTHLSKFIDEQRHLSGGPPSQAAFLVDSMAPPPPPHLNSLGLKQYLQNSSSEAQREKERMQELWKRYLAGVVAQRIKLRQEITLFQLLLANQSIPSIYQKKYSDIASSRHASIVHTSTNTEKREFSVSTVSSATESLVSVSDDFTLNDEMSAPEIESDVETLDLNVEKFQRVLNRRSMLGEMLDYESDSQLSLSSIAYLEDGLAKYATQKLQAYTETSSRYSDSDVSIMPRSPGFNRNLHLAAA